MEDPFVDNDPWMIQNAKGRAKPAPPPAPAPVTFSDFLPPGFSQIETSSSSQKNEDAPFGGPYTEEFSKIEFALEESLEDCEKRELALQRAISANVPWMKGRKNKMAEPSGIFKFGDESKAIPSNVFSSNMFKFGASYDKCECSQLHSHTYFTDKGIKSEFTLSSACKERYEEGGF